MRGMGIFGQTVEEMTGDEFRQTLETNLFGVFYACHYAVPLMKQRGGGYVFNISSLAGQNAHPRMAAYHASKYGLNGIFRSSHAGSEAGQYQGQLHCPGSVNTYFGGDSPTHEKAWQLQPSDIAEVVLGPAKHERPGSAEQSRDPPEQTSREVNLKILKRSARKAG